MNASGRPYRGSTAGGAADLFDSGITGQTGTMIAAKLTGGSAASAAQLVDADGTVLVDLSCPANGSDVVAVPITFVRKVRLGTVSGTGASVNVWIR